MFETEKQVGEAIDLVFDLETNLDSLIARIRNSETLCGLAGVKIDRYAGLRETFRNPGFNEISTVTSRLGCIDDLVETYNSQLILLKKKMNREFYIASIVYSCPFKKNKQKVKQKLDKIIDEFDKSRDILGPEGISKSILNYWGFLKEVDRINRVFDSMYKQYMSSAPQDKESLGSFAKKFEEDVAKRYKEAVKDHRKFPLLFLQYSYINNDATRVSEAADFKGHLDFHLNNFNRILEDYKGLEDNIKIAERQKGVIGSIANYSPENLTLIKSAHESAAQKRYNHLRGFWNLNGRVDFYLQTVENLKITAQNKLSEAKTSLSAELAALENMSEKNSVYMTAQNLDSYKKEIRAAKNLAERFRMIGLKEQAQKVEEVSGKLNRSVEALGTYTNSLKQNLKGINNAINCQTIDEAMIEVGSRKSSLKGISDEMKRLGSVTASYGLSSDDIISAEQYLAKTEEQLSQARDLRERVMQDCRALRNAVEVRDCNESLVDIDKYSRYSDKPIMHLISADVGEYQSLARALAREIRKSRPARQCIMPIREKKPELPRVHIQGVTVSTCEPKKTEDIKNYRLLYDMEEFNELYPQTQEYKQIKDVILGNPTREMPRRGFWAERLQFVTQKAVSYPTLGSEKDIKYFKGIADVLVELKERGFLHTFAQISPENPAMIDAAINSVNSLVCRSENTRIAA